MCGLDVHDKHNFGCFEVTGQKIRGKGAQGQLPKKKIVNDVKVMKALKDNLMFHNHPLPNSKLERGTC